MPLRFPKKLKTTFGRHAVIAGISLAGILPFSAGHTFAQDNSPPPPGSVPTQQKLDSTENRLDALLREQKRLLGEHRDERIHNARLRAELNGITVKDDNELLYKDVQISYPTSDKKFEIFTYDETTKEKNPNASPLDPIDDYPRAILVQNFSKKTTKASTQFSDWQTQALTFYLNALADRLPNARIILIDINSAAYGLERTVVMTHNTLGSENKTLPDGDFPYFRVVGPSLIEGKENLTSQLYTASLAITADGEFISVIPEHQEKFDANVKHLNRIFQNIATLCKRQNISLEQKRLDPNKKTETPNHEDSGPSNDP